MAAQTRAKWGSDVGCGTTQSRGKRPGHPAAQRGVTEIDPAPPYDDCVSGVGLVRQPGDGRHHMRNAGDSFAIALSAVLCLVLGEARGAVDVLGVMAAELDRSVEVLSGQTPPLHFLSYEITESEVVSVVASFGAHSATSRSDSRILDVDLRVGNRGLDNTHPVREGRGVRLPQACADTSPGVRPGCAALRALARDRQEAQGGDGAPCPGAGECEHPGGRGGSGRRFLGRAGRGVHRAAAIRCCGHLRMGREAQAVLGAVRGGRPHLFGLRGSFRDCGHAMVRQQRGGPDQNVGHVVSADGVRLDKS